MPITLSETLLPLAQAAKRLPRLRADRPVSPCTLWRWATSGLRGVRLETVKVGSVRCTSVEALERFLGALNGRTVRPPRQATHDAEVERRLATRGI